MRIYELAKQYNVSSNDLKDILHNLDITYKSHSSSIPLEKVKDVEKNIRLRIQALRKEAENAEQEPQKEVPQPSEPKKKTAKPKVKKAEEKKEEETSEPKPEIKSISKETSKPEQKPEVKKTEVKAEAKNESKKEDSKNISKSNLKVDSLKDLKAEVKSETKLEVKETKKAETPDIKKTETKAETKIEIKKAEPKTEIKADIKSEKKTSTDHKISSDHKAEAKPLLKTEGKTDQKSVDTTTPLVDPNQEPDTNSNEDLGFLDLEDEYDLTYNKHDKSHKPKKKPVLKPEDGEVSEVILDLPASITVEEGLTVKEFSDISNIPASDILKKLFLLGVVASINTNMDRDTIEIISEEYHIAVEFKAEEEKKVIVGEIEKEALVDSEDLLETRPPVVTIMGHVDHGKTTLLDTIRKARVVQTESGGITQHIGAYLVNHKGADICFIDTPGHAAFNSMRSMGANVTDIVILVVAANDGIKPQTIECINHAKEAEVPIIIAINKTDLPDVNIDKVKGELANHGLTPEDWGGDSLCVNISALKNLGIQELLDAIHFQSELLELKANPKGKAFGIVLESCQTDQQGPLVTLLVKNGTFKIGDAVICGHISGKIRRMENDKGESIKIATPSVPVRVFGFTEVPETAAQVKVCDNEKEAKEIAKAKSYSRKHTILQRKESITIENLYSSLQQGAIKEFKIILKTDVYGSIEAIKSLLSSLNSEKVILKVIHSSTGAVTDTDISFANAYNAIIFAYRVKITSSAQVLAKQYDLTIKEYDIIYHIYDDVLKSMEGMVDIEYEKVEIGKTEVKQLFKLGKQGVIAGCLVFEGKVLKDALCKIKREGALLEVESKIQTLKHYKEDVNEVRMGTECGIALKDFNDYLVGDTLIFYKLEKKKISL